MDLQKVLTLGKTQLRVLEYSKYADGAEDSFDLFLREHFEKLRDNPNQLLYENMRRVLNHAKA